MSYYGPKQEKLIGEQIVGIDVSDGDDSLRFRIEEGEPVVWTVDGDCCSHSWWHDAYSLGQLRGSTVRSVSSLDLPDPADQLDEDGHTGECIQAYGMVIVTDRGAAQLVFRNSSNGYYGGSCHDGVDTGHKWREITANDWQAGGPNDPPLLTPDEQAKADVEKAQQKFRNEVMSGLDECRRQLRTVFTSAPMWTDSGPWIDLVVGVQDKKTFDILVLGVYLTRMAEDTLRQQAARPVTDNPQA